MLPLKYLVDSLSLVSVLWRFLVLLSCTALHMPSWQISKRFESSTDSDNQSYELHIMKPRNVHNSIITTQALVRNMKSGLQEEPGGQDGHARLRKQALLHQGCSQLHTSKCRAKTTVSCKLHESYFCCRTIQKSSALCVPGARKPSPLSRDRSFKKSNKKVNFKKDPQRAQQSMFRKEAQYFTVGLIDNQSDVI